jgi:hypothetical protein
MCGNPKPGASWRKPAKIKLLAFAFSYFSELGLFRGLRRIQTKNFPSLFFAPSIASRASVPANEKVITHVSDYRKSIALTDLIVASSAEGRSVTRITAKVI